MERLKLASWAVAAAALAKIAFFGSEPVARAATGSLACEVFDGRMLIAGSGEKNEEKAREWLVPVQAWLEAHPGQTVYATVLSTGVHVICVRPSGT